MSFNAALRAAAHRIEDGATLNELREAARDLRLLSSDSILADLVGERIAIEERLVLLEERIKRMPK